MATSKVPIRFGKRDQLLTALEARRPWAKAYDAAQMKEHKVAEKAALESFRSRCRELGRMSYDRLKALEYPANRITFGPPSCPSSTAEQLEAEITAVTTSRQESWTIDAKDWRTATIHHLLTFDENAKTEMC